MKDRKGISVIICCYNSSARLPQTLHHLLVQQTTGFEYEIIVVDNASTDSTFETATYLLKKGSVPFTVVKELVPGLSSARKKGYDASRFEYILFCDDDNWLSFDYLQLAFETMEQNPGIGMLGGNGEAVFENVKPAWFEMYKINFAVGEQGITGTNGLAKVKAVYGAGLVVRKQILDKLEEIQFKSLLSDRKGNQLMSGGDTELCYVTGILGYEIWYNRNLTFKHLMTDKRMTWQYMKALYTGFGRMNVYLHAYDYFNQHHQLPGMGLRLPLWLDTIIHKLKTMWQYRTKVKQEVEGDEHVLRLCAMKGEIAELWKLKSSYNEVFTSILRLREKAATVKNNG